MTSDADAAEAFDILSRPFIFEMLHHIATDYATYAANSTLSLAIVGRFPKAVWPLSAESDVGRRYLERVCLGQKPSRSDRAGNGCFASLLKNDCPSAIDPIVAVPAFARLPEGYDARTNR